MPKFKHPSTEDREKMLQIVEEWYTEIKTLIEEDRVAKMNWRMSNKVAGTKGTPIPDWVIWGKSYDMHIMFKRGEEV